MVTSFSRWLSGKKYFLPVFFLFLVILAGLSVKKEAVAISNNTVSDQNLNFGIMSLPFVPNHGQWDTRARFKASLPHGSFWVTQEELVYVLNSRVAADGNDELIYKVENPVEEKRTVKTLTFREVFLDKNHLPLRFEPAGLEKSVTSVSWIRGQNPELWDTGLPGFQVVSLGEVYRGIEVCLKAHAGNVEKLFYLKPGASLRDLSIKVSGITKLKINKSGELMIVTEAGTLMMKKPEGYQEFEGGKKRVEVAYKLKGPDVYGFEIKGKYDPERILVIDPALTTLSASTFLGGKGNDRGYAVVVGDDSKIYVTGYTLYANNDFPVTDGVLDKTYNGLYDIFIARFSPDLKTLEAATYLGGEGTEYVFSMVVDSSGSLYLSGVTNSSDFPVTASAYQKSYGGGDYDTFVARISPDLSTLEASTFLGGKGLDYSSGLTLSPDGFVYLTGTTDSENFPVVGGPINSGPGGNYDVFVTRMSAGLETVSSSARIGGSDYDTGAAVVVNQQGKVFVAGRTRSSDFPVTPGIFDASYNGDYDGFVIRLDNELTNLEASTFIGGSNYDYLATLITGKSNDVFVAGYTASDDYPVVSNAFLTAREGSYDLFISRLSDNLKTLLASTYYGGDGDDRLRSIAQDDYGYIYIVGWTKSTDLSTTLGAYDRSHNGGWDGFIIKFPPSLTTLFAGTYLGGASDDFIYGVALDRDQNVFVTGYTLSSGFPATEGAADTTIESIDAFVAKFGTVDKYQLTVSRSGFGSGQIKSFEGGINCPDDCSEIYDKGLNIVLEAIPDEGSVFGGWIGDVTSTESKVVVTMDGDKNVTARFVPAGDYYTLTVVKTGTGTGKVTSKDGGIDCGEDCSEVYPAGTVVELTATADENSGFENWAGDAGGEEPTVSIIMDSDKQVVAVFGPTPLPDLTGELHDVKVKRLFGQVSVVTGYLTVKNIGQEMATSGYKVAFYLSGDGINPGDKVGTRSIYISLPKRSQKDVMFVCYVPNTISVSGKYLMAVIDSENVRQEKNENNNKAIFGPLE